VKNKVMHVFVMARAAPKGLQMKQNMTKRARHKVRGEAGVLVHISAHSPVIFDAPGPHGQITCTRALCALQMTISSANAENAVASTRRCLFAAGQREIFAD
jgi:hypothetical protein